MICAEEKKLIKNLTEDFSKEFWNETPYRITKYILRCRKHRWHEENNDTIRSYLHAIFSWKMLLIDIPKMRKEADASCGKS